MTFKPFHPIFEQASTFAALTVILAGEAPFNTTVAADSGDDLMDAIVRGLFDPEDDIPEYEQMIVSHIAATLSDPTVWTINALTSAPMSAVASYQDDEIDITVRVYTLTDGSIAPEVEQTTIELDGPSRMGEALLTSVGTLIMSARETNGVAFMGVADTKAILAMTALLAKDSPNFTYIQMGQRRSSPDDFHFYSKDNTLVSIEASFDSSHFADFGQQIMESPAFVKALDESGVTYIQMFGGKADIFKTIQQGAHALLGVRSLTHDITETVTNGG